MDKDFFNKTFLITGASGFIGSALTDTLLENGGSVHAISRSNQDKQAKNLTWWNGDGTEQSFIQNVISSTDPEIVFHLAGFVDGTRDLDAVIPAYHNNLTSTVNILTSLAKNRCEKVVLAGSMEEPERYKYPVIPSSPYAAAKWAGNGYANMFRELYNVPVVNARIFMVYGPGQFERNKLIPYLILSYLNNERPVIRSTDRLIDWVYIEDVVSGLLAAADYKATNGHRIDIGSGEQVSVGFISNLLYEIIEPDCEPPLVKEVTRAMEQEKVADISKNNGINWKPETTLREGLTKTVEWYKKIK